MRFSKKFASLLLALTLLLTMAVPALAASITITSGASPDVAQTETTKYTYYQIFNASINATDKAKVVYSIPASKADLANAIDALAIDGDDLFTVTLSRDVYIVTLNKKSSGGDFSGAEVAEALNCDAVKNNALASGTFAQTEPGGTATADDLTPGYYLILSSLGTNLALNTLSDVSIQEKNDYPTSTKKVVEPTVSYGQEVHYTVNVYIPTNVAEKPITVVDRITSGLTMNTANGAIDVTVSPNTEAFTTLTWTEEEPDEDGRMVYTVEIPADIVLANAGKTLTLFYTATVNANAVVNVPEHNSAYIVYDNYTTVEVDTTVITHGFTVKKIDGAKVTEDMSNEEKFALDALDGAEFTLWSAASGGTEIKLVALDSEGTIIEPTDAATPVAKYRVAQNDEEKTKAVRIKAGEATIHGLAAGTYYLQEDKAPAGYNPLAERQEIVVSASTSPTGVDVAVENNSGAVMPSTGGMGTTILYVAGSILLVGAAVILIAKRRANADK